jgi:hypothetical protein
LIVGHAGEVLRQGGQHGRKALPVRFGAVNEQQQRAGTAEFIRGGDAIGRYVAHLALRLGTQAREILVTIGVERCARLPEDLLGEVRLDHDPVGIEELHLHIGGTGNRACEACDAGAVQAAEQLV